MGVRGMAQIKVPLKVLQNKKKLNRAIELPINENKIVIDSASR